MATITVSDYQKAVSEYIKVDKKTIAADFGKALKSTLDPYAKKVTKVKGNFVNYHRLLSHVVQGFRPQWDELGEASIEHKKLKNFHQKFNYPVIPAEILSSALADMYEEGKKLSDKQITRLIIKDLLATVADDVAYLSIKGVYDAANAFAQFGKSMDGIEEVIADITANTSHPAYKIPLNALTDDNIVDEITKFEKKLPKFFKNKIKEIHMSENNVERYILKYEDTYGRNTTFKDGDKFKTRLGKRVLVGHPDMADDVIFATPEGNLLKLIDVIDNPPTITDVQVQDYKLKLFGEFWLGYDFGINEAVMVANFADNTEGLGDAALMAKYYPHQ